MFVSVVNLGLNSEKSSLASLQDIQNTEQEEIQFKTKQDINDNPVFLSVSAEPQKVKVGETLTITTEIKDKNGIEKVTAIMPHNKGADEIQLFLISGNNKNGKYQGQWKVYDTHNKEYITTITAINVLGKSAIQEVSWWDDVETTWYDSNWSYRKKITITGGASGAQTDYQVKLDIAYIAVMQSDFDDIQFTQADGTTLIDAWLESKVDDTSADIWVEFPTTPANTVEQTYYMYYGNAGAASDWDGAATFLEFWDFEDNTLQGFSVQTAVAVTSAISKRGTYCVDLYDASSSAYYRGDMWRSDFNYQSGVLEWDAYRTPVGNLEYMMSLQDGATNVFGHTIVGSDSEKIEHFIGATRTDYSNGVAYATGNAWEKHSIQFDESTPYMSAEVGGVDLGTGGRANAGTIDTLKFSSNASTPTGRYGYVDDIRLRKYTANPPTYEFGAEEKRPHAPGTSPSGGGVMMF